MIGWISLVDLGGGPLLHASMQGLSSCLAAAGGGLPLYQMYLRCSIYQ
ncbi:hypothetical protein SynNOUM97013_01117 [Synechococcus sp. NOUM97013]|nr:hypothetical protein SynNOUM97013_01117 [Synechococcus sp. NOUM97013]